MEWVLDQLRIQAPIGSERDPNHGISNRTAPFRQGAVLRGGRHHGAALAGADRLERRAESVAAPRLHLDHDEVPAPPAHQVQLAPPGEKSHADDLVAARPQEVGGRLLARST